MSRPALSRARRCGLLVLLLAVVAAGPARAQVAYALPEGARLVRAFEPPATRYGPGHRGIDLAVAAGAPVRPLGPGRVAFAGPVAGRRWVTVEHADGIRTTYGTLATVAVRAGDAVTTGTVLGTATGAVHAPDSGALHVSARRGDRYLDPLDLIAPPPSVPTLVGAPDVELRRAPADPRPTLVPGAPPSPNHLVLVAGLTSATGDLPLDPAGLGYAPDDTSQFSYRGVDGTGAPRPYDSADTWGRVHDAALALREQLRARWAATGDEAVDLVGHSLGGVVALYYLLVLHDPADPTLPPVGRVATIASPLQGADLAAAAERIRRDPVAGALLGLVDRALPGVDADGGVLADLTPGSAVTTAITRAWARAHRDRYGGPLATGTEVLTVGALLDPIVPAHRTDLPDTVHHTVLDTHGGAPTDPATTALLTSFLSGGPLSEASLGQRLLDVAAGPVSGSVGLLEQLAGLLVAGAV